MYSFSLEQLKAIPFTEEDARDAMVSAFGDEVYNESFQDSVSTHQFVTELIESYVVDSAPPIVGALIRLVGAMTTHTSMTVWNNLLGPHSPQHIPENNFILSSEHIHTKLVTFMEMLGVDDGDRTGLEAYSDFAKFLTALASGQIQLTSL